MEFVLKDCPDFKSDLKEAAASLIFLCGLSPFGLTTTCWLIENK